MANSSKLTKAISFRVPMEYYFEVKKQAVNKGYTLSDEIMERLFTLHKLDENGVSLQSFEALQMENRRLKSQLEDIEHRLVDDHSKQVQELSDAHEFIINDYKKQIKMLGLKVKASDAMYQAEINRKKLEGE